MTATIDVDRPRTARVVLSDGDIIRKRSLQPAATVETSRIPGPNAWGQRRAPAKPLQPIKT
jgi:hypothetical protein